MFHILTNFQLQILFVNFKLSGLKFNLSPFIPNSTPKALQISNKQAIMPCFCYILMRKTFLYHICEAYCQRKFFNDEILGFLVGGQRHYSHTQHRAWIREGTYSTETKVIRDTEIRCMKYSKSVPFYQVKGDFGLDRLHKIIHMIPILLLRKIWTNTTGLINQKVSANP